MSFLAKIFALLQLAHFSRSEPLDFVNLFVGSSYFENKLDVHDYGNAIPQVGAPFAHTPWTPQTRHDENKCTSPYYYFDMYWTGMRRTHWIDGSCTIDYGSTTVIPSLNASIESALVLHKLDHSNEIATVASYEVYLPESALHIKASSYQRAGIMETTPSESLHQLYYYLIFTAFDSMYNDSSVTVDSTYGPNDTVYVNNPAHRWYQGKGLGTGFSGHHVFVSSRIPVEVGIIEGYNEVRTGQMKGRSSSLLGPVAAYMKFDYAGGPVTLSTACSFVSAEKALSNLNNELGSPAATEGDKGSRSTGATPSNSTSTGLLDMFNVEKLIERVKGGWNERFRVVNLMPHKRNDKAGNVGSANKEKKMDVSIRNKKEYLRYKQDEYQPDEEGGRLSYEQDISGDKLAGNEILITFYTALWHTLLLPRVVSDFDGEYLSFGADTVRTVKSTHFNSSSVNGGFVNYYDDFSMWDIFRAQVPLLNLLYSDVVRDMVASLVAKADDGGGWLPIFPAWNSYTGEMIGDHCTVFLADSFIKGSIPLTGANSEANIALLEKACFYALKNALISPSEEDYKSGKGRRALKSYIRYGFIPLEDTVSDSPHTEQQVSRTLDYAYDDYVVAQLLQFYVDNVLSAEEADTSSSPSNSKPQVSESLEVLLQAAYLSSIEEAIALLLRRSKENYKLVIDAPGGVGFVRGRYANLTWAENTSQFNPGNHYPWLTETNVWQYTWSVMHDVEGMIELYGGGENFTRKLDEFFDGGWYNHGNEPDHHSLYLYAYVPNQAWNIQKRLPALVRSQYGPGERDLPGNEDAGQMSAWLVLSALGFYQVCPGCGSASEYVLGVPLFAHAELQLPSTSPKTTAAAATASSLSKTTGTTAIRPPPSRILRIETIRGSTGGSSTGGSSTGGSSSAAAVPVGVNSGDIIQGEQEQDVITTQFDTITTNNKAGGGLKRREEGSKEDKQPLATPLSNTAGIGNKEAWYIQKVTWNGCEYNCAFFPHDMLAGGGHLIAYLGTEPNKTWGGDGRQCMQDYAHCRAHSRLPRIHTQPHIRLFPKPTIDTMTIAIICGVVGFVAITAIATLVYLACMRSRILGYNHMSQSIRNFSQQHQHQRDQGSDTVTTFFPSGPRGPASGNDDDADVDVTSHSESGSAML